MTHSIIIHSTDPNSYNAILPVIYSPESVYTVAGISQDAPTLLRLIDEMNPSVLIIDCTLTESGCFDLIRQVRASYGYELQILAMGARDFDSVYQAIQAGANHYLLFPIQKKELLSCLSTLCIARERILRKNTASRNFYLADNNTDILRDHPLTLRQLNLTYGTNFVEGLFQMLFVKFDFPNSFERLNPENTPVFLHLNEFITNYFKEDCAYIIYEIKKDGIIFLLNYRQDIQTSVNLKINKIFDQIANMIHTLRSMDITICVSSSVNDPCKIWEIKKQVREAEWSRMYYGVNKLIFWTPTTREVQLQAEEKLNQSSKISAAPSPD